jgi:hypothetical protein
MCSIGNHATTQDDAITEALRTMSCFASIFLSLASINVAE